MSVKELKLSAVEINAILENMPNELLERIPLSVKDFFKQIASESYHFEYDKSKGLNEQNLMPKTKGVLALLYRDYISTENQREEFINYYNSYLENKQKAQIITTISKEEPHIQTIEQTTSNAMISTISNDKWYEKIFHLIKNIFKK